MVRGFIFHMYIPFGTTFSVVKSQDHLSRSNSQGHIFQKMRALVLHKYCLFLLCFHEDFSSW